MNDYENLKRSYIAAIQFGMTTGANYNEARYGNELLHKFCEECIDSSNYSEYDKQHMKQELKCVKETLSNEIEHQYGCK